MTKDVKGPLEVALAALGASPAEAERLSFAPAESRLPSRLAVDEIGAACIGAALVMAARLQDARGGPPITAELDGRGVQTAIRSERYFLVEGEPAGAGFAPLSRFWRAADGWVRTHANFLWHREALLGALGARDDEALAGLIESLPAAEVEAKVFAAGGVAAAVRSPEEWRSHPQGRAVAEEPLIARERLGDAPAREHRRPVDGGAQDRAGLANVGLSDASRTSERADAGHLEPGPLPGPAAGIRVLDLTRVIAGPVCSRYLGALGADVLRLDPPALPDLEPGQPFDTLLGKRSAFLDLGTSEGAANLETLLADADVILEGYRPDSLDRFGLGADDLADRHPGLVVVQLAAWGHTGPWAERRGFDSIVQAASGIVTAEAGDDGSPGALPCQLLDHGTGYLAAAAALDALAEQRREGGSHLRRLSLARTAAWLLESPADTDAPAAVARDEEEPTLVDVTGPVPVSAVPPPGVLGGDPLRWPEPASVYGADAPRWSR